MKETSAYTGNSADLEKVIEESAIHVRDFINMDIPARPYILKPWLRSGTLALVHAFRGIGKTWFALSLGLSVTRQCPLGKWNAESPANCLYIDGEMAVEELHMRLRALSQGLPPEKGQLCIMCADLMKSEFQLKPNIADERWRAAIYNHLERQSGLNVLILDNLASLTPGLDENTRQEWDGVNQWLLSLRALGIAVILIHHAGKSGSQRGTSAREDNNDVSLQLTRPTGYKLADGAKFVVSFTKTRGVYGEDAASFCLRLVSNGNGLTWALENPAVKLEDYIIALLGLKMKQKDIAEILGCSAPYVTQIKQQAIKDEYLDEDCNITDTGAGYRADSVEEVMAQYNYECGIN